MTGYKSEEYVRALSEFGEPLELPYCGGWLLKRPISKSSLADAMGSYPLFSCREWGGLFKGLDEVGNQLVSVALVTDPFTTLSRAELEGYFDRVSAYKDHLLVDLEPSPESFINSHHRYYARKALRDVQVEVVESPLTFLNEWCALYQHLVGRHELTGLKAFSEASFSGQLKVPGMVVFKAMQGESVVGAHLWVVQGEGAYSHLAATNESGYKLSASYALYWEAIHYFRSRVKWLDIGAAAGAGNAESGLARFKQGWSNAVRPAYFCGKIFDRNAYARLSASSLEDGNTYFPAYRCGEF